MSKAMACDPFGESGTGGGLLHGLPEHRFVQVVTIDVADIRED